MNGAADTHTPRQSADHLIVIVLASGGFTLLVSFLVLIATAVFSPTTRSHRALSVLEMLLHGRHARYVRQNRSR